MAYCGHNELLLPLVLLLDLLSSCSKQGPGAGLFALCDSSHRMGSQLARTVAGLCPKLGSHPHQLSGLGKAESSTPSQPKLEVHTDLVPSLPE